jgi:hypothetical protein
LSNTGTLGLLLAHDTEIEQAQARRTRAMGQNGGTGLGQDTCSTPLRILLGARCVGPADAATASPRWAASQRRPITRRHY